MNGVIKIEACVSLILIVVIMGCGGTYDSAVTGIIVLDGVPLPRGTVSFIPDQKGPSAYGLIDADGSYTLQTGRKAGLPAGDYIVTVVANEPSFEKEPGATPTPGKPITPAWYRSKLISPLKYKLEKGKNVIDIELSSTPPAGWQDPAQRARR